MQRFAEILALTLDSYEFLIACGKESFSSQHTHLLDGNLVAAELNGGVFWYCLRVVIRRVHGQRADREQENCGHILELPGIRTIVRPYWF